MIVGRLIFSEFDTALLLLKLDHLLLHFAITDNALVKHFELDFQTAALLSLALIYILVEIFSRRLKLIKFKCIKFNRYKFMRNVWLWPVLIGLSIAFGSSGLGAVYGAR